MALLSKEEAKLQKKGVPNMSLDELKEWVNICTRNEEAVSHNKARRSWKDGRREAQERIEKLST
jgi:hypothetical protein